MFKCLLPCASSCLLEVYIWITRESGNLFCCQTQPRAEIGSVLYFAFCLFKAKMCSRCTGSGRQLDSTSCVYSTSDQTISHFYFKHSFFFQHANNTGGNNTGSKQSSLAKGLLVQFHPSP